jgi:hypothetical protein
MIYVFEGIEGVGKTSTASRFARRSGLEVYNDPSRRAPAAAERTPGDWMRLGNQANLDVAEFARIADFVVDRWCLSSMTLDFLRGVYAGDDFYRLIARNTRARIFLLEIDPELALARATRVRERGLTIQILEERRKRYREVAYLWSSWGGEVHFVDTSKEDLDESIGVADSGLGDRFGDLLLRQRAFNTEVFAARGLRLGDLSEADRERWTSEFVLHAEDELHEFLRETHWKMHLRHDDRQISRENLREEWVDTLKFLLGLANVWDLGADELVEEFYRKSAIVEVKFRAK